MNRKLVALALAAAVAASALGVTALAAEGEDPVSQETAVSESAQDPASSDSPSSESAPQDPASSDPAASEPASSDPAASEPASEESSSQKADQPEEPPAGEEPPMEIAPDPVGTLSFPNLKSRMMEHNLTILALEESIGSIEAIDYEKLTEDLRKQLNGIATLQWALHTSGDPSGSLAASSMESAYNALRDTFDSLRDGEMQEDNQAVIRQLEHTQNQLLMAGESLYVALVEMELSDGTLNRQGAALDRTIQELELRYELGQISALTLQETKAGRTSLVSGQNTLQMNIENYKTQLELMVGAELTGAVQLQPLPQVSGEELAAMDLEKDMAAAKEASYDLLAAKRTLDDAQENFKDSTKGISRKETNYKYVSAKHTWQAAQYTYNATVQNFESGLRTLYLQVKDCKQILDAAKVSLACEQDSYAASQLKYEQGTLSKNKLLDAQDKVAAAQDAVNTAAIDLFTAYNNYRWAVDYGILN